MIPIESSAGAIIFKKEESNIYYLILHYNAGHWGLVKGHIEGGETFKKTIIRETGEETGISDLKFIDGFKEKTEYFFERDGKKIFKINHILLAKTKKDEIHLSEEHRDFRWLSYHQAIEKITFDQTKKVLKKAHEFLKL